jgi:hypothetical protein
MAEVAREGGVIAAPRVRAVVAHHLPSEFEGGLAELVQADGRPELRASAAPGNGDVDGGGDRIDEVMARQCRLQADRGHRRPFRDLDEVEIGRRSVGPSVRTAAERDDVSPVAKAVDALIPQARPSRLTVSERVTEQRADVSVFTRPHGRKCYPYQEYVGSISSPEAMLRPSGRRPRMPAHREPCAVAQLGCVAPPWRPDPGRAALGDL